MSRRPRMTPTRCFLSTDTTSNDDESPGSQQLEDGVEKYPKTAITPNAWEAASSAHRNTLRLESARGDSSCRPHGGAVTSNSTQHHRGTKKGGAGEEDKAIFEGVTGKASPSMHEALPSRASPLPSPPAHSPKFEPLQRDSHERTDSTCATLRAGSNRQLSDPGGGPNNPKEDLKEGSTTESVCHSSNNSGLDDDSRPNDGGSDDHFHAESPFSGGRATPPSPGFEPPARERADHRGPARDIERKTSPPARRGTKRRNTTDITLEQVIDHHMARRRLNEVASDRERLQVEGNSSCARASSGDHMATADNVRSKNYHRLNGKQPSAGAGSCAATSQGSSSDCPAIVAAAWTNGCILPLTKVVAHHMRLVAPVLAAEPEGRRVVIHTAATVAAGAAVLSLPDHRLEVTGTSGDGLLLELRPREEGVRCSNSLGQSEESAFLSACAERLQATFDGLVKLDLEFDMVRLPHGEAMEMMGTGSSSAELIHWLNEGATTLVRLSAPSAPPPTGSLPTDQAQDLVELREALAHPSGAPFLGIDCNLWPLLPRTGLLASFSVDIHLVVPTPSEPSRGGSSARRSVIHLAVTVSDSGVSLGSRSGSLGALLGSGCQSTRATPGLDVAGAQGAPGSVVSSAAAAVDILQRHDRPLRYASPTCTVGGLTWRHVTGLRCVAAVNRLALGPRNELEGKLQLSEGLHTAEVSGVWFDG